MTKPILCWLRHNNQNHFFLIATKVAQNPIFFMKKFLFSFAVLSATLFASCNKDTDAITPDLPESTVGSVVNISFTDDQSATRAFFGDTASAETWEKSVGSLTMYVFDSDGGIITNRKFSDSELSLMTSTFALAGVSSGDQCTFYVVANDTSIGYVEDEQTLLAAIENSADVYNGTFAQVSGGAQRDGGFLMSGSTVETISDGSTDVKLTLKRTVAKVAVQVATSSSFSSIYSGDIKINSITVSKAATQSYVVAQSTPSTGAMSYSFSQASNISGSDYQNLFYLFENGALADGSKVTLTIDATYDADGNFSTSTDQSEMSYELTLDGSSSGAISRNGYYRVSVSVDGLSGADASLAITVEDWETTVTQSVSLGA